MKHDKNSWPRVIWSGNAKVTVYKRKTPAGNDSFLVAYFLNGKRVMESHHPESKALEVAQQKADTLSTHGAKVAATSTDDIAELVRLTDLLKPRNITVTKACETINRWLLTFPDVEAIDRVLAGVPLNTVSVTDCTVEKAREKFIAQKESEKLSAAYVKDLKWRLDAFKADFKCSVGTITRAQIVTWLNNRKMVATSFNNFRTVLHAFFEYCTGLGYCAANPVTEIKHRKSDSDDENEVYTPDEMRRMLKCATEEFLPRLALCAFAGLRTQEFRRLTWEAIDFEQGYVILAKAVVKKHRTATRRLVPLSDNLRAWLQPYKDKNCKGLIWPSKEDIHKVQRECAKCAKVECKDNALRHSYCSYRLALTGDDIRVAHEAGNSAKTIHAHYKALVTEADAKEWFNIKPT